MFFVPLHIYSCYSILESSLTIEKIIKNAQKNNYHVIALTDLNSLSAAISFSIKTQKKNIQPIIGLDLKIDNDLLTFIIQNEKGYFNLLQIFNLFNSKQLTLEKCEQYCDGIVTIISSKESNLIDKFQKLGVSNFDHYLKKYQKIFKNFYIGVEIYDINEKKEFQEIRIFFKQKKYNLVAFPLIRYEKKEDGILYDILQAIKKNQKIKQTQKNGINYFYSFKEIEKLYEIEEINQTEIISKNINFNIVQKRSNPIKFTNKNRNDDEYLTQIAHKLLKKKITKLNNTYLDRLNYELNIIKNMQFSNYFLIVMDYINFAKKQNILVGPGRGSVGGSLVAYALDITTIDPIKEKLIFERFLNQDQKNMPDIDVDFEDDKRENIIKYLKQKYGAPNVANILTIQTLKAKQTLRDIGNIYRIKENYINLLCKEIKNFNSLKEAYQNNQIFKKTINQDNYFKFIFETAQKIENLPRQISTHAAGIIINDKPLNYSLPIYNNTNNQLIGIEKNDLEKIGFMKFDILGLRTLSIIKNIIKDIKKQKNINLNFETIPYNDENSINLIHKGETIGLFQLESENVKKIIQQIKPTQFNDVVSLIAICRPGPIKFIKQFIKQKNNEQKINYYHKNLIHILQPTYGIIIFQEQIIEIIHTITKLSFSESDLLRREMLKKNKKKIKDFFIKKAISNNYDIIESTEIFEFISNFCDYSFNKSHACLYAKLSCQMAYLKNYFPICFYKNTLNDKDNIDIFMEIQKKQIDIELPNINISTDEYIIYENKIFCPLTKIKTISKTIILSIIEERKKGQYISFIDFVTRNIKNLDINTIKNLIKTGCFDFFNLSRIALLDSLEYIMQFAQLTFNIHNKKTVIEPIITNKNSSKNDLNELIDEFYGLGMILSKKFTSFYKEIKQKEDITKIIEIKRNNDEKSHKILGIIEKINYIKTKNNKTNVIITINDGTDNIDILFFDNIYQKIKNKINNNGVLLIKGIYKIKYSTFQCQELINFYEKINNN